jgi:hypothetical protein
MSIATVTPIRPTPAARPTRAARPPRGTEPNWSRTAPAAPRAGRNPLRLTRRGRVVLRLFALLVVVVLVTGGVLVLQRAASASSTPVAPVRVTYHVVLPGETLWSIASDELPGTEVRDAVAGISELNALSDGRVYAGQRLAVAVAATPTR